MLASSSATSSLFRYPSPCYTYLVGVLPLCHLRPSCWRRSGPVLGPPSVSVCLIDGSCFLHLGRQDHTPGPFYALRLDTARLPRILFVSYDSLSNSPQGRGSRRQHYLQQLPTYLPLTFAPLAEGWGSTGRTHPLPAAAGGGTLPHPPATRGGHCIK